MLKLAGRWPNLESRGNCKTIEINSLRRIRQSRERGLSFGCFIAQPLRRNETPEYYDSRGQERGSLGLPLIQM
jgi:hypothetical protein